MFVRDLSIRPIWAIWIPVLGVLAYSHDAVFSRMAIGDPVVTAAARFTIAALVLLPFSCRRGNPLAALGWRERGFMVLAGALLGVDLAMWVASAQLTSIANSLFLSHLAPLWLVVASALWFMRPPGRHELLVIILALGGMVCIAGGSLAGGGGTLRGDLIATGSSVLTAVYLVMSARMSGRVPICVYVGVVYASAALFLWAVVIGTGRPLPELTGTTVAGIVGMGLVAQLVGHGLLTWSLRWFKPVAIAVITLVEPVLGSFWGRVYFAESPAALALAGGALVIAALWYSTRLRLPA